MCGLKHILKQLWAKLKIRKRSTTKRFKEAEHRCEETERELSDMDRYIEDIQHQILCPQESVDAVTVQMEVAAKTRTSASTERVTAVDSQLYKTQVNWKLRIRLIDASLVNHLLTSILGI
jgi:predicted  nucleic acid-binding Zn-ribbon protein